ncbi:Male sterility protein [Aspergillus sp. HF37]|nr:Male sterility protein [Aspergillus sp. HF37]
MEQLLVQCANASSDALAVVDGNAEISYKQLISRADALSQALCERDIKPAEPVCIFLPPSLQQIVAQVAILRAGGTCVPIDPSVPSLRVTAMLHDIDSQYVITGQELADTLPGFCVITINDAEVAISGDNPIRVRAGCSETHCTHILFTSGSTGRPKAIQILARGILHVVRHFPGSSIGPPDRMSAFINPGFDLSLLEVWMPLLCGAAVVSTPKAIITDPLACRDFLDKTGVTTLVVPTALFNVMAHAAPNTFQGRHHVFVAGEAANATAMRKALTHGPPENLWNAYGPTETTIYATLCRIDLEETRRPRISIGRAVGHTEIQLLDEQHNPIVTTNKTGEICVSGPQLSAGYLNMSEENKEKFIHIDIVTPAKGPSTSIGLYRTGDLGQWRDRTGVLDYIGRVDGQIKRFGYRVELGDIERTLETHPQVHSCVINQNKRDTADSLTAYVVPTEWDESPGLGEILVAWSRPRLPPYMVPDVVQTLPKFPLTANGKVDRKALVPETRVDPGGRVPNREISPASEDQYDWLELKLRDYLNVSRIDRNDNIFSLGLSSLQAAQLLGDIMRDQGTPVTMAQLHSNPTLKSLKSLIESPTKETDDPLQMVRWEQDSHMADDIASPPDWQAASEGRVFLTGATGFLGTYLLHYLLSMPTVKQVACLARSSGNMTANARIQKALEKYELWDGKLEKMQKIIVLEGDLAHDSLGLAEDQFHWLANWASVVFHVGARVNWCEPYEAHYEPNVVGTRNVIRLTVHGRRKALQYLSSIDTWNVTGFVNKVERVFEDEPLQPHMASLAYDLGYSQSQWVVDEMVQRARARGLPAVIYRPGFIIGDRSRAIGNPDDFFGRLVIGCIQCGYFPYLPRQRLEWVTVDYVCSAILHIASRFNSLGRAYHLVSTDPTRSVSMEGTCKLINEAGYPVQQIPYHEWVAKIQQSPGNALEPLLPALQESVLGGNTRIQTGTYNPVYDAQNTVQALAVRPDIQYVPLDAQLLRRYVEFWVQRGDYNLS